MRGVLGSLLELVVADLCWHMAQRLDRVALGRAFARVAAAGVPDDGRAREPDRRPCPLTVSGSSAAYSAGYLVMVWTIFFIQCALARVTRAAPAVRDHLTSLA